MGCSKNYITKATKMKISREEEIRCLGRTRLFQNLKAEELKIISLATQNFIYEQGEVIISEGDEGDSAYVIYSGEAEVYRSLGDGKSVFLNRLGPGEMFGELALFGDGFRSASVMATREMLAAVIAKDKLYEILRGFPDIAIEMLKVQTDRFFSAEKRLIEILKDKQKEQK